MNTQTQEVTGAVTTANALKMAIERLQISNELIITGETTVKNEQAIQACKEALAQPAQEVGDAEIKQMLDDIEYYQKRVEELEQPAQEPVAWMLFDVYGNGEYVPNDNNKFFTLQTTAKQKPIPLYTHPAPSWQGLSDDEIQSITWKVWGSDALEPELDYAHAIEAKLKEKNHE